MTRKSSKSDVNASHARGVVVGSNNQQINLPSIRIVVEHIGTVIDSVTAQMRRENERTQAQLHHLQRRLHEEQVRSQELRKQAAELESALHAGAARQRELQKQILQAEKDSQLQIAFLQDDMKALQARLAQSLESHTELREQQKRLNQIEYELEGRGLVQFERAQVAELDNESLRNEIAALRAVLTRYQQIDL